MVDQENVAPVSGQRRCPRRRGRGRSSKGRGRKAGGKHPFPKQSATGDAETRSHELAMEYLKLGGRRRAAMDDNITETRKWEPDPPEAEAFWQSNVAPLPEAERKQVEDHLPSINAE